MRIDIIKIINLALLFSVCSYANALDTSSEEKICSEIGFKRKTEAFGNCVLELAERNTNTQPSSNPDDATCKKYGFKSGTTDYAKCRQQIDLAREQANQQRLKYEEEQRIYNAQVEEQKKQRQKAASMALLGMGLGMMSGQNPGGGYSNFSGSPPVPPQNLNRTYILPGGKIMNCNSTGSVTNCF
jgi:hypothetical protein